MKPSGVLVLGLSAACLLLFAEAGTQGGFRAFCSRHGYRLAAKRKPCPETRQAVCGTDGQTYENPCEFCRAAVVQNGKLGVKHEGKCNVAIVQLPCLDFILERIFPDTKGP